MTDRWKAGMLIRNKETGKPFLVLSVSRGVCTFLADAEASEPVSIVLLEKNYDQFATDKEMKQILKKNETGYNEHWVYEGLTL